MCLLLTLSSASSGEDHAESEVLNELLIQTVETPEQHEALARFYRDKSADMRREAEHHRRMAKGYAVASMRSRDSQRDHCNRLVTLYERMAQEYEGLADAHEWHAER